MVMQDGTTKMSVSIHAPREGCDRMYNFSPKDEYKFQFTHPGRGATRQPT